MVKNFLRILVCPLDWGLGHAARMVPVIKLLMEENHQVILAADKRPFAFLKEQFPGITIIKFPGFRVSYPDGGNMALHMLKQLPGLLWHTLQEHRALNRLIREHAIDVVISDNRFGLWSKKSYTIYVTHQLNIKTPRSMRSFEPLLRFLHVRIISRYDECWIPDLPGPFNLSGELSHRSVLPRNCHYIGWLSRFSESGYIHGQGQFLSVPDMLVLLSGPEPQRSILENLVMRDLEKEKVKQITILRGLPENPGLHARLGKHIVYNHLNDEELAHLIRNAGVIVCRSGYSTLMDLISLGRSAVLVPTPGQTEQEYLATYLEAGKCFASLPQHKFSLSAAWHLGKKTQVFKNEDGMDSRTLLFERISLLKNRIIKNE